MTRCDAKLALRTTLLLCILCLGAQATAAVLTVTTASDALAADGDCSLREAITAANTNAAVNECPAGEASLDIIGFAIPGAGVHTIAPASALPALNGPVFLDGYTQLGSSPNTLDVGNDAVLTIELEGFAAGAVDGLVLQAGASGSTVRGLVINRFRSGSADVAGIFLDGATGVTVEGNFVGTDPFGTVAAPNYFGINVLSSPGNILGGAAPASRNLISGNANSGVRITSSASQDNVVRGNYIGVDRSGTLALGNGNQGLRVDSAAFNMVGGPLAGEGNVISANAAEGVRLSFATGAVVEGNWVGTDALGNAVLGNFLGGVQIFNAAGMTVTANTIAGNGGLGIDLDPDGVSPTDGVTANDLGDPDSGANDLQNYPVLSSAVGDGAALTVEGTLNSEPDLAYTLEFYANEACDESGHGEGEEFLGEWDVATDGSGDANFAAMVDPVTDGTVITATATSEDGSTSEFSACIIAVPEPSHALLLVTGALVLLGAQRLRVGRA